MLAATKSIFITLSLGFTLMHSCASKSAYNPYLHAKEKPSDKQRKEEKQQMKIGEKAYKQQMKENKKVIRENNDSFFDKKAQYRKTTRVKRHHKKYSFHF